MQKLHYNLYLRWRCSLMTMRRLLPLLNFILLGLVGYRLLFPLPLLADETPLSAQTPVTHKIRYHIVGAKEVFLVWGINNWKTVPEAWRPPGTVIKNAVMYTPMNAMGDNFIAQVQAPAGATIAYAFQITKNHDGAPIDLWDTNGEPNRNYHAIATKGKVEEITAALEIREQPLVTQEIRYHVADAGEVFLVWGINGWTQIPEGQRREGTVVKDTVMYTPMARVGDAFTVMVKVPYRAAIDYAFQITKKQDGTDLAVWDTNGRPKKNYQTIAMPGGIAEVQATVSLTPIPEPPPRFGARLSLFFTLSLFLSFIVVFRFALRTRYARRVHESILTPRAARAILIGLTVLGLGLRLFMAWSTNQVLPDSPDRLDGDETGYEGLAYWLTQGYFFNWPGRVPVYPTFLAVCYLIFGRSPATVLYVQAFVGALTIPLTFLLARRFTGEKGSLLAAMLVAVHPALIFHVRVLYTEVLYAPLLLLALLGLVRAIEQPRPHRFVIGGILLAVTNLCRPTASLFPLLVPFLLPQAWPLTRKLFLSLIYATAMVMVIAPWTYHNYKTHHVFLPLSISGVVLWHGSPEFYHLMEQNHDLVQIWNEQLNPKLNGGYDAFTIVGDRYFAARAIASIKAEPGVYAWYSLQKLAFFWIGHPAADWPNQAFFSIEDMRHDYSWRRVIGAFITRLLPLAALLSLFALRHRLRDFALLFAICGYLLFVHMVAYPEMRYSEPLHPLLCIMITAAVSEMLMFQYRRQQVLTFAKEAPAKEFAKLQSDV